MTLDESQHAKRAVSTITMKIREAFPEAAACLVGINNFVVLPKKQFFKSNERCNFVSSSHYEAR